MMSLKPLKKSETEQEFFPIEVLRRSVKKILVILLSNIGDVVVTLPVLDILIKEFINNCRI